MKKVLNILKILLWITLAGGTATLMGFVESEQFFRTCKQVYVTIEYDNNDVLLVRADIDSIIRRAQGTMIGKSMGWINAERIENAIRMHPYVAKVDIYESNNGDLFVDVKQRAPMLRIITRNQQSIYLDASGNFLPLHPDRPARVLVATGNIDDAFIRKPMIPRSLMADLHHLATYISHDQFLNAQMEQIFVTPDQEFELIPKVGNHVILFGNTGNMEEKFKKLFLFYKFGLNKIGWNRYHIINIKFKNQVVCLKR
jgi:cell division protein FtsQ